MALPLWVDFFEDLQRVRGRSRNTVMAYRRDLELYDEFKSKDWDVSRIFEFMNTKGLSVRSQARVISSIRTYLKFIQSRGLEAPELRQLRPPKVKASLPKVLTDDDFKKLYEACDVGDASRTARNKITLLMLFGLGCRVSEMIQLNLQDFNEQESWVKIIGKGNKERLVPVTERLRNELKSYIVNFRGPLLRSKTDSILINDRGKRPSRVDLWRWLAAWSEKAGFDHTIGPHQFRHGCATALLESGADLRSIQMLLGHSSIQTTQIYTTVSSKKLQDTVLEHHPLSDKDLD
ncbi:MAG: tyrosine-type recombinase/integrase [Bdellovibrionales bacterium]|nr:tyrosine-type recombinase/integrase [Bdellovibrionales bacterium]